MSGDYVVQPAAQNICHLSNVIGYFMAYIIGYEPWYYNVKNIFSFVTDMENSCF